MAVTGFEGDYGRDRTEVLSPPKKRRAIIIGAGTAVTSVVAATVFLLGGGSGGESEVTAGPEPTEGEAPAEAKTDLISELAGKTLVAGEVYEFGPDAEGTMSFS